MLNGLPAYIGSKPSQPTIRSPTAPPLTPDEVPAITVRFGLAYVKASYDTLCCLDRRGGPPMLTYYTGSLVWAEPNVDRQQ